METKIWALGVLIATGVSLLSADSAKKYMHIYTHAYIYLLHIYLYIHIIYMCTNIHTNTRKHQFISIPPISVRP